MEGARPPAPPPPPALAAAGRRAPCARSAGSSRGITGARAAPASPAASPACRPTSAAPPAPASAPAPSPSRSPSSTATSSSPITTCWRRRARSGSRPTGCSTASAAASRDAMAPSCCRGSPSSARPRSAGASDSPSKPEFSMDHVCNLLLVSTGISARHTFLPVSAARSGRGASVAEAEKTGLSLDSFKTTVVKRDDKNIHKSSTLSRTSLGDWRQVRQKLCPVSISSPLGNFAQMDCVLHSKRIGQLRGLEAVKNLAP
ncbi:uncharacterized protein [Aegilops tauschii subsp. strangulata]|uniref:uncharacterized protein isoform X2 n=1 Tax=Aegilops tauschii subsp. strangulata TaxID=200361 RepID=UPI00098B2407|nr:mucin-1 isoform X2 [Aegilops tauschii subsp. strangulata]